MALAVGARAGEHGDLAGSLDAHCAAFKSGAAAWFDKSGKADPDDLALFAPVVTTAHQLVVVGDFQRFAQRLLVIAGIIFNAGAGGVRKLLGLNEIFPAYFEAVHAQDGGSFVEQSLDVEHRLGATSAAIRTGGASVGKHRDDFDAAVLDLVAAARHAEHALRRTGGARMQIGAEIGDHFDFQAENFAVLAEGQFRSHRLVAPLDGRDEVFAAASDPFDRLAQLEREMTGY